jgi:hypothetical protein
VKCHILVAGLVNQLTVYLALVLYIAQQAPAISTAVLISRVGEVCGMPVPDTKHPPTCTPHAQVLEPGSWQAANIALRC